MSSFSSCDMNQNHDGKKVTKICRLKYKYLSNEMDREQRQIEIALYLNNYTLPYQQ